MPLGYTTNAVEEDTAGDASRENALEEYANILGGAFQSNQFPLRSLLPFSL